MIAFNYVGRELELFEKAGNWKAYWQSRLRGCVRGDVLEVGAGIGVNTLGLAGAAFRSWTCLEPDAALAGRISRPSASHRLVVGTTSDLPEAEAFDCILYIDVLEHIEDDGAELSRAARLLRPGGTVAVLSPAHPYLYTKFDEAIGHCRRYTRESLGKVGEAAGLRVRTLFYLDSAGIAASLGNRILLRSAMPTEGQIAVWDRWLVPVSRVLDPLLGWSVGKSVLGVWTK